MAIGNINNGEIGSSVRSKLNLLIDEVNDEVVKLTGTQYIYVKANGTDTENATELQSAYNTAKTMSPSATNRITIIAGMGNYNFGSSSFDMDTEYIDLVSLDGNRSVIFNATLNSSSLTTRTQGSINITANDVFVKGVDVLTKKFTIGDNLNLLKAENCQGGNSSFARNGTASGTFTNCVGGGASFGVFGTASGTFTNCVGGTFSFGSDGTASGTFTNCVGGDFSFARDGIASGTFTNCVGGSSSFARGGTASGTFTDCVGGDFSFGTDDTASGTFSNCVGGNASFGTDGTASGTFTNCVGGESSFARDGTASGTFTNCVGGTFSFGVNDTASGTFSNCVGGNASFGTSGTASGTFTNCIGGVNCFGVFGTLNGKLYYCRLTTGTFQTVATGGLTRLCIDGNNNENNQG